MTGQALVSPREDIGLMQGYHSPQLDVSVRLNTNEAPLPPPAAFGERLAVRVAGVSWNRYPDRSYRSLRSALAERHGVEPEQIFVANGSNEVLQSLCLAYGGPGRTAAVFEPTYALHSHIARVTATGLAVGERADDFSLDRDELRRVIVAAEPTLTFLCSPNNPTGVVDPPEIVADVVGQAPGLVVVDEAYAEFAPWSAAEMIRDDRPLVVTRTYSKTWAMAGARLGYLLGPRSVVAELDKVVLPYHLDAFKQLAGTIALEFVDEMQARVAGLVEERGRFVAALHDLPVVVWPSGANFVLVRPTERSGAEVWQDLVDRSVLVRDCSSWPRLEGCLRITIGTPAEDDICLDALKEVLL